MKSPAWFNRPLTTTMMILPVEAVAGPIAAVVLGAEAHHPAEAQAVLSNPFISVKQKNCTFADQVLRAYFFTRTREKNNKKYNSQNDMNTFKRFLTLILITTLAVSAWAVPAYRGWQERTLSDGTPVTVRQIGDEFYHFWETQDGKLALEQEDGTFVISEEGRPTGEQIASRRKMARMFPSKSRKAIGDLNLAPRGLVILVQFSGAGESFQSGNDKTAMTNMLNQEGYNYDGATGSAVDYFKAQSNNTYAPIFDVVGPVTLDNNLKYYGEQGSIGGYDQNDMYIADFVIDAVTKADAAGCDFSKYDGDNDGYVDIVYFIYAGKGQADGGSTNTIWPHNWELASALWYGTTHGGSGYSYSNLPRFDTKRINNYACSGELNGSGGRSGIGTLCHEFSHVLGLPDYYVTDDEAANSGKKYTPGAWSIMDYGSYNNDGKTPPNYSPHDKLYFNWSTPEFLAKDAKKNCTLTTTYGSAYQITGTTTSAGAKSSSRVWYLEYRKKSGWDKYLPGHGMVVWEVQYNSTNWTNNTPNNSSVGYTLVTANTANNQNPRPYEPCVYNTTASSTSGTPFPGTSNVTSYTPATGCALTNITESSNDITFKYNGGEDKTRAAYEFVTDHCTAPADGDVAINAALSVTITPNSGYTLDDASCWTVEMGGVNLTYGSGFTYNASTNTFYIASLTDDVVIMAEAKVVRTVTWSVQGITSTTTFADGAALVLPSNPSDCSGEGGKKFVGWTTSSTVSGSAPADLFNSAGTKTVTANTTYYAVYATASGSGGGTGGNVTITTSTANIPTSYGSANTFTEYTLEGYKFKIQQMYLNGGKLQWRASTHASGAGTMYNNETFPGKITSIVLTYNSSDGNKNFTVKVGNAANPSSGTSITPTISGSVYTFDCSSANADYFVLTNGSGAGYLDQIVINYGGGGGSYSDYSLVCGTPCSNTPSMSFSPTIVNKTTADDSFTKAVTISEKGSGQTVTYSSSDESVATVNNSGVVTLKGKVGSTTITASVEASGTSCAASASYTLNVTAAPIDVTLYYNGTSTTLANQANPYILPTGSPYNTAMCSGDWTFVGWYSSEYSKSTTAPTYITQLTATSSAYAVYTTTETSGSGGSSEVASVTFANASSDGSADKSGSISDLVASASGISSYSGSKVYAGTTGIKIGSGSAVGSITITLSSAADVKTVKVTTKKYGSDTGTLSVKAGDTSIGSAQAPPASTGELTFTAESAVTNASTITVATSSKRAYIASITVIADGGGTTTTYYATSPDCAGPPVPTYTVLWKACGEIFKSETYSEGNPLVLPDTAPEDNAGKSFAGWTTSEHYTGADAPTLITAGGAVNADVTYYAVFH